jgi:uncharacterized protein (TIGR02145 family)
VIVLPGLNGYFCLINIKNGLKMKMISVLAVVILTASIVRAQDNTLTDERDNKVYKTIKVGDKIWMAENLNYDTAGSVCYKEKAANCEAYGRLYGISSAKKACPAGWHLPSRFEMDDFLRASTGRDDFFTYNGLTSAPIYLFGNFSDLNFTYGGYSTLSGKFENLDKEVWFWTSEDIGQGSWVQYSLDKEKFWIRSAPYMVAYKCYVRCVKD